MTFSITFDDHQRPVTANGRHCGSCTLCCKLVPVRELDKKAGQRCQHQSHAKGCKVYQRPGMPMSCSLWSCRWLTQADTAGLSRPDRSHYVIDMMPDFVSVLDHATGQRMSIEVIQIWIDPNFPDAHRDPALRAYLEEYGKRGIMALVRYNSETAISLIPPSMTDGEWVEFRNGEQDPREHDVIEVAEALKDAVRPRFTGRPE